MRDRERRAARSPEQRERARIARKAHYEENRERQIAEARAWIEANRDKHNARQRQYEARNREQAKERSKAWRKANMRKKLAQNKLRIERVRTAMPPWADRFAIMSIYMNAPAGHEVDHIVPLRGRTAEGHCVSGLHVPWNLQYLPKLANRQKHCNVMPGDELAAKEIGP
jgi:hypothetical protein